MKLKILFDEKVVMDVEVKKAEISSIRECIGIYRTADFKANDVHKCYEIAPSVKNRICIDVLDDETMPNSEFYTMECNSLPKKIRNVTITCPECSKNVKIEI
jgi:hypothetical protein